MRMSFHFAKLTKNFLLSRKFTRNTSQEMTIHSTVTDTQDCNEAPLGHRTVSYRPHVPHIGAQCNGIALVHSLES